MNGNEAPAEQPRRVRTADVVAPAAPHVATQISPPSRGDLGRQGERAAAVFLISRGYRVLDLNWRAGKTGEIDIVAAKGQLVVFVEVKTRTRMSADDALAAVDAAKLRRLTRLGAIWMSKNGRGRPCRFDVIGVQLREGHEPIFEWLRDVAQ